MSKYDDNRDNRFGQDAALAKLRLDSGSLNNVIPLDKVYERIQKDQDDIKQYQNKLRSFSSPSVSGDWYRLGGVGADSINSALSSVIRHVREGFNLISCTERSQSESLKNVCLLIGLLAVAEGKLYAQFTDLTSDSEKTADVLKDLEDDLNEIASNEDSAEENIKKIAQVMANILDEKNKQVLAFKSLLNKNREDSNNAIQAVKKELDEFKTFSGERVNRVENTVSTLGSKVTSVENTVSTLGTKLHDVGQKQAAVHQDLRQQVNGFISEKDTFLKNSFSDLQDKQMESLGNMQTAMDQEFEKQKQFIVNRTKKSFFDSTIYKILCGLLSVAAVAIALLA